MGTMVEKVDFDRHAKNAEQTSFARRKISAGQWSRETRFAADNARERNRVDVAARRCRATVKRDRLHLVVNG